MGQAVIIDDFLDDYKSFRYHCDHVNYDGITSPVDDIFYPGVSLDIPAEIAGEVKNKITHRLGADIDVKYMFLRLSVDGVHDPHIAHTDSSMGEYSAMLYLNKTNDCIGGTAFLTHKDTGLNSNPINEKQELVWRRDHSRFDAWQISNMLSMRQNRLVMFNSDHMHAALPVGGFGSSAKDGRLVLVCFFDVEA